MMNKPTLAITTLLCAGIALAACAPGIQPGGPAGVPLPLEGTPWTLGSYVDSQGNTVSVLSGSEVTAKFQNGQANGNAGCNNYFGSYQVSGSKLTVDVGGVTRMFCEGLMEQEGAYLAALGNAASYQISGQQLQIADAAGKTVLTFAVLELEPQPLTGTTWQLHAYNNGKGGVVSVLAGSEITAVFGADGKVSGSAGCNNYSASYQVEGSNISFDASVTTRMACQEPQGVMEQESAYLAALESAAAYQITGDKLEMTTAAGTQALTFTAK